MALSMEIAHKSVSQGKYIAKKIISYVWCEHTERIPTNNNKKC